MFPAADVNVLAQFMEAVSTGSTRRLQAKQQVDFQALGPDFNPAGSAALNERKAPTRRAVKA